MVHIINTKTGTNIPVTQLPGPLQKVKCSPDSKKIVIIQRTSIKILNTNTGTLITSIDHDGVINGVSINSSSTILATASEDGIVKLLDMNSGKTLATIAHNGPVKKVRFSPDGTRLVTASSDHTSKIIDAENFTVIATIKQNEAIRFIKYSPDSSLVAISGDILVLVETHTGTVCTSLNKRPKKKGVFSPDSTKYAFRSVDTQVLATRLGIIMNARTGTTIAQYVDAKSITFSPDGTKCAIYCTERIASNSRIDIIDMQTGHVIFSKKHAERKISLIHFSPDSSKIMVLWWIYDEKVAIYGIPTLPDKDLISLAQKRSIPLSPLLTIKHEPTTTITETAVSPDSTKILTQSQLGVTQLKCIKTGATLLTIKNTMRALFSPDSRKLAVWFIDRTVMVIDIETNKIIARTIHQLHVRSMAFSPDSTKFISASDDKTAVLIDVLTGQVITTLTHDAEVVDAFFSPDSTKVVTRSLDKTAMIVDVLTVRLIASVQHTDAINWIAFSPDSQKLVTASDDKTVILVDIPTAKIITTVQHEEIVMQATFSADSTKVYTVCADKTVRAINLTGEVIVVQSKKFHDGVKILISKDSSKILIARYKYLKILDAQTGRIIAKLPNNKYIQWIGMSPDSSKIAILPQNSSYITIIDARLGIALCEIKHNPKSGSRTTTATFSDDSTMLITHITHTTTHGDNSRMLVTHALDVTTKIWSFPKLSPAHPPALVPPAEGERSESTNSENLERASVKRKREDISNQN